MFTFYRNGIVGKKLLSLHRLYSTQTCNYGICLDIDGVLIKGRKALPQAKKALSFLSGENVLQKKIPFLLLSNGGGMTEAKKAADLTRTIDFPISPQQLVLSHTPMQSLVSKYQESMVLVVGGTGDLCAEVAKSYGFKRVVIPEDVLRWEPSIWPLAPIMKEIAEAPRYDFSKEAIQVVMVLHDSYNCQYRWGRDIQIMLDVLQSKNGYIGTLTPETEEILHQIPLYFSNPDFIWSNEFPIPRFGQGAFRIAFESIYSEATGRKLKYELFGKPETSTYRYAERLLADQTYEIYKRRILPKHVYAVGDNPAADIAGANAHNWNSILVRTGVFEGKDNDAQFPADHVAQDVFEAVEYMFHQEEGR
ncbi:7370_t:CDS:10 [Ambispora gerdemannii]|uniref:7370_t:CDS:1 n=1 Tax=Ambispora gerdemannii TaxID=144530 RepID=A0A9N8V2T5_9GLOM|nr:7370_t:CDS:10 [Ambispora gerdemannii]